MPTKIAALLAALLAALAAVGCANPGTLASNYEVRISPDFTADQQSAIVEACRDWMGAVPELRLSPVIESCRGVENGVICIRPGTQEQVDVIALSIGGDRGALAVTYDEAGQFSRSTISGGLFGHDGGEVTAITKDLPLPREFEWVAAHEMGHAMGLVHTGSQTIMCQDAGCSRTHGEYLFSATDIAQWRSFR